MITIFYYKHLFLEYFCDPAVFFLCLSGSHTYNSELCQHRGITATCNTFKSFLFTVEPAYLVPKRLNVMLKIFEKQSNMLER